jgi:predicted nucleotidyltransferase component of viral defense system
MQLSSPKDAKHKAWLYRTLLALSDDASLAQTLSFKGGTCAAMLGLLDRFSVDLDFDFVGEKKDLPALRQRMEKVFKELGLTIKDQSKVTPQYFLKYQASESERNTVKIDVTFPPVKANQYEQKRLTEIDRILWCQTPETMFANKLVALIDRYEKRNSVAGRDVYDIHHFFESGLRYTEAVITERTKKPVEEFFQDLIVFVEREVTDDMLAQDLNALVPYEKFRVIRKTLKLETLMFLRDEVARLNTNGKR